jgi:UDP-glucose 4-epimerase
MNLGNGKGFSVFEVIDAVKHVTGRSLEFEVAARRPGDPPVLVADASLARQALDWSPRHVTIDGIIETAWRFHASRQR